MTKEEKKEQPFKDKEKSPLKNNENNGQNENELVSNNLDNIINISDSTSINNPKPTKLKGKKISSIILAVLPLVILAGMIYFLSSPYGQNLIGTSILLPQVTIEKIEFHENQIQAFIRNTGPEQVIISQADINDRIQSAAIEPSQVLPRFADAKVIIPFFWNPAEPYEVGITTSDGTRFSKTIEAAAPAPIPNINQISVFALIGVFVGVIPVLIGLAWYPFMRKITRNQYNFFLSLTAGLLVFLGIEALFESNEIAVTNLAPTFNGQMLIPVVIITTFLGLTYLSEYFIRRAESKALQGQNYYTQTSTDAGHISLKDKDKVTETSKKNSSMSMSKLQTTEYSKNLDKGQQQKTQIIQRQDLIKPLTISLMIAIGIGLHNFGEGLAIGAAVLLGEIALGTFLIIGFTIHNTTEGLAIVAPLAKTGKLMIKRLILMGLIAGIPTILGTWIGGFVYSPLASIIFLSVGAGAIFQVVYSLASWMSKSLKQSNDMNIREGTVSESREEDKDHSNLLSVKKSDPRAALIAGFIIGMLIMYTTGLLV